MGFFNRIRADPGFVSRVRSDPGFVGPIRSDPIRSGPIQILSTATELHVGLFLPTLPPNLISVGLNKGMDYCGE